VRAQGTDDLTPSALAAGASDGGADSVGVDDQAHAVALLERDVAEGGGEGGGVVELGPVAAAVGAFGDAGAGGVGEGARAEVHGAGGVDEDEQVEVGFLLVLFELEFVGAAEDFPVEVTEVVAGDVLAVLGELDAEASEGRAVQAGGEALDDHAGAKLEAAEAGEGLGVEIEGGVDVGRGLGDVEMDVVLASACAGAGLDAGVGERGERRARFVAGGFKADVGHVEEMVSARGGCTG